MKRFIKILCLFLLIFLSISGGQAFADEVKIGASPMSYPDVKLEKGASITLPLEIANTSKKPGTNTDSNTYTYNIHLDVITQDDSQYAKISDAEKDLVMASRWIKFSENNFNLKPGENKKLEVSLEVPSSVNIGEQIAIINITSTPVRPDKDDKPSFGVNFIPSMQIPLIIHISDPNSKEDGLKESSEVKSFEVTDKIVEKDLKSTILGLLSPTTGFKNRWHDFLYQPMKLSYGSGNNKVTVYDIPKSEKVLLRNAITSSEVSDTKYMKVPTDLKDSSSVDQIFFDKNMINIVSNGANYKIESPSLEVASDIQTQLTNLATTLTKPPTWGWVLDNIKLNKRYTQQFVNLYFKYTFKNSGTKTIVPSGEVSILDDNNQVVLNKPYSEAIITPGKEKDVIATIKYDPVKLTTGTYSIKSSIKPYKSATAIPLDQKIKIEHIRGKVIAGFVISFVVLVALIVGAVLFIKKKINKKKLSAANTVEV